MLERVGDNGHVTALDISRSALDTLASKAGSRNARLTCIESSLENVDFSRERELREEV